MPRAMQVASRACYKLVADMLLRGAHSGRYRLQGQDRKSEDLQRTCERHQTYPGTILAGKDSILRSYQLCSICSS